MARSLVETFAGLTLLQQRRVFEMLREILDENERTAALAERANRGVIDGENGDAQR